MEKFCLFRGGQKSCSTTLELKSCSWMQSGLDEMDAGDLLKSILTGPGRLHLLIKYRQWFKTILIFCQRRMVGDFSCLWMQKTDDCIEISKGTYHFLFEQWWLGVHYISKWKWQFWRTVPSRALAEQWPCRRRKSGVIIQSNLIFAWLHT